MSPPYSGNSSGSTITAPAPLATVELEEQLKISGPLDLAVRDYVAWQKARVFDKQQRRAWNKARDIALEQGYDLQLIVDDREKFEEFLVSRDIRRGVARRFGRDIQEWSSIDEGKRPVAPTTDSEGSTAGGEADE
jgi:hypothetical protein